MREGDGRFKEQNREWAKNLGITQDRHNYEFALNSHSCIVDCLAGEVRKMYDELAQEQLSELSEEQNNSPEMKM